MTVGSPNVSSTKSLGRNDRSFGPLPIRAAMSVLGRGQDPAHHRVGLRVHPGDVQRVVAAADAQEARRTARTPSGPAAARRPARSGCGTARGCRGAPTIWAASPSVIPETRRSSGTEAVLTSTPTAFTQSSTTASSERDSADSARSCWYWPTPMDFGSIFTSSASGSCSRRAMDTAPRSETSSSGSSAEA